MCVSLPPGYPFSPSAPQLQLLSRYIGPFGVDSELFGTITRTFISSDPSRSGLPLWNPPDPVIEGSSTDQGVGEVVIFDGVENARAMITKWYEEKASRAAASESARAEESTPGHPGNQDDATETIIESVPPPKGPIGFPEGIEIVEGAPIHDRGSTFVARVCHITQPSQVGTLFDPFTIGGLTLVFLRTAHFTARFNKSSNICVIISIFGALHILQ